MNIQSRRSPAPKAGPAFSYNAQDPAVGGAGATHLEDLQKSVEELPSTDRVKLRNFHFLMDDLGQPMGLNKDTEFQLAPSERGDFVYPQDSPEFTSANVFATAARTVSTFEKHLKRYTGQTLKWAFPEKQLGVAPLAGQRIEKPFPNALYTRFELERGKGQQGNLFFFDFQNKDGQPTSTGNSGEVVAHETGHAILDALKPNYFTSHSFEAAAFHEAFGDMVATLMSLESAAGRESIVEQTGGDLSLPNAASVVGEEVGQVLESGARSTLNDFVYTDPEKLPGEAGPNELARDSHSFGRVFSGAFYEILDKLNDAHMADGKTPDEALQATAHDGWRLLVGQVDHATDGSFVSFKELAQAMIDGDTALNEGRNQEVLEQVFRRRNLLPGAGGPRQARSELTIVGGFGLESLGLLSEPSDSVVPMEFSLSEEFGELAGATIKAQYEVSLFKSDDRGLKQAALQREIAFLAEQGEILVPQPGRELSLSDFLKPDGSHYHAYLDRESNELKRVPLT